MTPANVPLTVWRNADYAETWVIAESFDNAGDAVNPVDLSGYTLALQVRMYGLAGGDALISLTTVTTATEGVRIVEATAGQVEIRITDATLETLPEPGKPGSSVSYVYDLVLTDPTGLRQVYAEGAFIIQPGVTR